MSGGKSARNVFIAIAAVSLGLIIVVAVALRTGFVNGLLQAEISRQLQERFGARVEIEKLNAHIIPPSLELKNVVVNESRSPAVEPPLFRAERILVGVELLPLLHRKVELSELIVDGPIARLRINAEGGNNLTFTSASSAGTSKSGPAVLFELKIQNCAIHGGEFYYNDAQIPVSAELHNLQFVAGYSRFSGGYKGSLSYDRGRWSEPGLAPIEHEMQMEFAATPAVLSIRSLRLRSGSSDIAFEGRVENFADPVIDATYQANLFTRELAMIFREPATPTGKITVEGTLNYHSLPEQSFLAALHAQGHMRSDRLFVSGAASGTERGLAVSAVNADYELKAGGLRIDNLRASALGGSLQASASIERLDAAAPTVELDASVRGVSLDVASSKFAAPSMRRIPFEGVADLQARASWTGPFADWSQNLVATARLSLASSNRGQAVNSQAIPVNGSVLIDYNAPQNKISFGQSYVQTKATTFSISGTLDSRGGRDSAVRVKATTSDLREVGSLFTTIEAALAPTGQATTIPELGGSATLTASATGAASAPQIQGELAAQKLSIGGSHWRSLRADLTANPSKVSVRNASLAGESNEQIAFSGDAGLYAWSLTDNSQIALRATAGGIQATEISHIAGLNYPVTGAVSVNLSLKGTRGSPEGTARVMLANGSAWNQPFSRLVLDGDFHQGGIHSTANLQIPAGTVSSDVTYTLATQAYSLQVHGAGLKLDQIAALAGRDIQGTADLSATGMGTLGDPEIAANLSFPQLNVAGKAISNVTTQINVAHEHVQISLHSVVDQGSVEGTADVDLAGNRYTMATVDVSSLPVAAIAANFVPAQSAGIGGQTEAHLTLHGPLAFPAQLQAHLDIPSLNVTFGGAQLSLVHSLQADYQNGLITVMKSQIQGTGTNLTFSGTIPVVKDSSVSAYVINADGTIDLSVLHRFAASIDSRGELDIHVVSQGGTNQPSMRGEIEVKNAVFSSEASPVSVGGLNGTIALAGNRATIEKLSGAVGGGKISANGSMEFGRQTHFTLGLNAQSVRIRYPAGLRSVLNAQVNAEGSPEGSTLVGRVTIDSLSLTQQFDLATFLGSLSEDSAAGPASSFEDKMKVNLAIQSAPDLTLASSRLSVGGSANLNMIGTLAKPVLLGRVSLTSGEIFYLSKRFELQNGTIAFADATHTNPVLNLFVNTTIEQYNLTLKLTGPVDRLRTNYTSDPSLSQVDIIHLLAFGNTNAEAASAPASSVASSAESVLASGVTGQLTGKFQSLTGLSQLTIDPLATNTEGDPGAQVAIQQRVTGSILFTYSTNVTDTQDQTASLQYDVNKRLSVTILRDQNGGYGVDVRVHKVF